MSGKQKKLPSSLEALGRLKISNYEEGGENVLNPFEFRVYESEGSL